MDSFKFNQISMAVLSVIFVVFGTSLLSEGFFHSDVPEKAGFEIEVAESTASTGSNEPAKPAYEDIKPLLASADMGSGEKVFKKCAACHTVDEGGAKKVGPNLYDIVNKTIAGDADFGYSSALKAYGEGKTWTYDELNGFFFKPKTHVKGTAMGFAGLKKAKDRADLIGWLRSKSGSPALLPGS